MATYEAWWDPADESYTCGTSAGLAEQRKNGLLSPEATLLYSFEAATTEEAYSIHSLRMGWGPYMPLGDPSECPRCGAWFYRDGSGECWRCNTSE
jgi:hypothetical protein